MSLRARVTAAALAVVVLAALTITVLRMEVYSGGPAMLRFEPRIAESACLRDPVMFGVGPLVDLARLQRVDRLRVGWFVYAYSTRAARSLSRELRSKRFAVDLTPVATQTTVRAERTENASYRSLRATAKLIRTAAGTSADLVMAESPRGGCDGRLVGMN